VIEANTLGLVAVGGALFGSDVVGQAKVAEGGFGFFELLLGDATIGLHFDADLEFETLRGGEFGQDCGVELHPLLMRNFAGPGDRGEGELLGSFLFCSGFAFRPRRGFLRFARLAGLGLGLGLRRSGFCLQIGFGGFPGDEEHLFGEFDVAGHYGLVKGEGLVIVVAGLFLPFAMPSW